MRNSLALLLAVAAAVAQPPRYEMTTYVTGFLKKGPKWTAAETPESAEIQKQHIAHLEKMAASGKLIVAGPFRGGDGDGDPRGMLIFHGLTVEEARAMASEDPAVKAGRLTVEIRGWMAAKGLKIDPPAR